jgi:hypothetical protein
MCLTLSFSFQFHFFFLSFAFFLALHFSSSFQHNFNPRRLNKKEEAAAINSKEKSEKQETFQKKKNLKVSDFIIFSAGEDL